MCSKIALYYLFGFAWVLFNFYLKQKQTFSVWSLTENTPFISFYGRIWSRYSEINKFKKSTYLSKNNKNTLKNAGFKGNFKGALSGQKQFLATEIPLKMIKNAFYFISKTLFVLKIFKFLS